MLIESSTAAKPPPPSVAGSSLSFRTKERSLPPVQPSAAERVALYKADFVSRPQTEAARQYIQASISTKTKSMMQSNELYEITNY